MASALQTISVAAIGLGRVAIESFKRGRIQKESSHRVSPDWLDRVHAEVPTTSSVPRVSRPIRELDNYRRSYGQSRFLRSIYAQFPRMARLNEFLLRRSDALRKRRILRLLVKAICLQLCVKSFVIYL
jgi:hypothetical protein